MTNEVDCHDHEENGRRESKQDVWLKTLLVNGMFGAGQLVVAWLFLGSVTLLADGFHNFSDGFTLGLPLIAVRLLGAAHNAMWTNGHKREMNFVAVINFVTLVVVMGIATYEAVGRFNNPREFSGGWLIVAGVASIAVNVWTMRTLSRAHSHSHHVHSLALKSAVTHQFGDAASSVVLLTSGLIVRFTGWHAADPSLTIMMAVGLIILAFTKGGGLEAMRVVAGRTPSHINMERVTEELFCICGNVHAISISPEGPRTKLMFHVESTSNADEQVRLSQEIDSAMFSLGINDVYPRFHPPGPCHHEGERYGKAVLPGEDPDDKYGHSH